MFKNNLYNKFYNIFIYKIFKKSNGDHFHFCRVLTANNINLN